MLGSRGRGGWRARRVAVGRACVESQCDRPTGRGRDWRARARQHAPGILCRPPRHACAVRVRRGSAGGRGACRAGRQATGWRAPALVADMRRVFDDPRVDIVSIATPHHWHALAAIWAMQAGKDVYVEKPVSHNVRGRPLHGAGRSAASAHLPGRACRARSNPGMIAAVEFVRGGGIGRVASGACHLLQTARRRWGHAGSIRCRSTSTTISGSARPAAAPLTRPHFHHDWHWQWPYGNGELGHQGIASAGSLPLGTGCPRSAAAC